METKHTPGMWLIATSNSWRRIISLSGGTVCEPVIQPDGHADLHFPNGGEGGPDARLLITAPDLLQEIEREYEELADIGNDWPGRNTMSGQIKLGRLRDLIAKATGRDSKEVQDDYSMRGALARQARSQA